MSVVGLDLAAIETRPTGFCRLTGMNVETANLFSDQEIISRSKQSNPMIIAMDAPLSLPPGRKTIEDRSGPHLRLSDRALLREGIKFFPITLGPMRKLTVRGIRLRNIFENMGFKAIEVYPGGAQDVLGIPRKQKGLLNLRTGLEKLEISGLKDTMNDHELDAVTCAYVGKLYLERKAVAYGPFKDAIIMPARKKN
jgi:predicted nuclease with RNAse H fold